MAFPPDNSSPCLLLKVATRGLDSVLAENHVCPILTAMDIAPNKSDGKKWSCRLRQSLPDLETWYLDVLCTLLRVLKKVKAMKQTENGCRQAISKPNLKKIGEQTAEK